MPEQGMFDFQDGAARSLVAGVKIKSRGVAKQILLAMASHEARHMGTLPTIQQLGEAVKRSRRAVQYGLRELEALGLVEGLRIVWKRVDTLTRRGGATETEGGATLKLHPCIAPVQRGGATPQSAGGVGGGALPPAMMVIDKRASLKSKTHSDHSHADGDGKTDGILKVKRRGWWGRMKPLTASDLTEPRSVSRLFDYAVNKGRFQRTQFDEIRFRALCEYCAREGDGDDGPGGLLTYRVFKCNPPNCAVHETDTDKSREDILSRERSRRTVIVPAAEIVASAFRLPPSESEDNSKTDADSAPGSFAARVDSIRRKSLRERDRR